MDTVPYKAHRLPLVALLLLAFFLATFRLDGQSLWYDEGVTAQVAQQGIAELTRWTAGDIQPPLYYYVVAAFGQLAGWSEWALRLPSAWFATLATALMAALALRLANSARVALLAALFTALHPLVLYYGQEARMYAQLTALAVLAGYLLVRLAGSDNPPRWLWPAFVATATAAVYTHYFALFLLLGLATAYLFDVWRWQPASLRRRKSVSLLTAGLAVLLFYTPWLAALFGQLRGDRSYWTGALKVQEALLDVALAFTGGESVLERIGVWLLVGYALVTLLAIVRLWRGAEPGRRVLLYAALWLLAPVVAVLLLAVAVPKFNARYVMVALPGLLLLWAGGLGITPTARAVSKPAARPAVVDTAAILFLVVGFAYATSGWFFNPAFSKDQWRQLVDFLRPRITETEKVVLVSGHAWPVWNYYAPDLDPVRLPELEILDVDAVLDFEVTGPPLQQAFADETGLRGAWLVNWQDEVVDPNGIVPVQLELSGREKGQSAEFFGLGLRRFTGLRPYRFVDAPPVEFPLDVTFGDMVKLVGYKPVNNGDLLLFWQRAPGAAASDADLHFALSSFTNDGAPLAVAPDRRLAGYTYPFARWQPGEIVTAHIKAVDWLGSAEPQPGQYGFTLRVYDAGDPAATPLTTGDGNQEVRVEAIDVTID